MMKVLQVVRESYFRNLADISQIGSLCCWLTVSAGAGQEEQFLKQFKEV